jgi:hypothetical protein
MDLYGDGAPICPGCLVREALTQEVLENTAKKGEAFRKFEETILRVPSGLPHPDGAQRIRHASNDLTFARKEMARAYARLADYLDHGIVPEDLKAKVKKASTA